MFISSKNVLWDGLKILLDLKILWVLVSRWAKFCEFYLTMWDMACMCYMNFYYDVWGLAL